MNKYSEWSNNMNNKNKIVNLGYHLTIIIIELMLFLLLNILKICIMNYKNENNNRNNYNKIMNLS